MNAPITLTLVILLCLTSMGYSDTNIKRPNVSGQFYTADPKKLSDEIDDFLKKADLKATDKRAHVVIVPHAGYLYSGAVAAYGFKAASHNPYRTVVILAPSHYHGFDGISVWPQGGFQTPLGIVDVDQEFAQRLIQEDAKFSFSSQVFEQEHSLEVEIPFLQKIFQNFKIVPIIMGQPSFALLEKFAISLNKIIGDREDVLIVVSTDLSHYHPDSKARVMDAAAIHAIEAFDARTIWDQCQSRTVIEMCGFVPTTAALLYAQHRKFKDVEVLRYANSGDVTGDRERVVGYTSIVIYDHLSTTPSRLEDRAATQTASLDALTLLQKKRLLAIARQTMEEYVRTGKVIEFEESDARLIRDDGAFVTIHDRRKQLRGCIGNIIGRGPLYQTVRNMAMAAATQDHRFTPVRPEELNQLEVEISVLSKPREIQDIAEIVLGKHGVILSQGPLYQGVFLPQVATDTGWTKEEFLRQLSSQKAGLAPDSWKDPQTKIEIFTAEVFSENDIR